MQQTRDHEIFEIALYSILFLFFLQLLSDFIESIYAFALLGTGIPPELVVMLLLFSPTLLLLWRRCLPAWSLLLLGELVIASRIVAVLLDTQAKMILSGFGVAFFLVLFPSILCSLSRRGRRGSGLPMVAGLMVSVVLSILFRSLYSGVDITNARQFQFIGWILGLIAAVMMPGILIRESKPSNSASSAQTYDQKIMGAVTVIGLSLGLMAVFVMLYFAFASPNVIARWTGGSYLWIISLPLISICLLGLFFSGVLWVKVLLVPILIWTSNILFILSLVITILGHQIAFPVDLGAYPTMAPAVNPIFQISLALMLILFPIVLVDFGLFVEQLLDTQLTLRRLGIGFSLASLFLMLIVLAQVFTTAYDYIPVVGPFFRDKFWFVYLVVGVVLILPLFLVKKDAFGYERTLQEPGSYRLLIGCLVLLSIISVAAISINSPKPPPAVREANSLKVLTYNIQQAYSEDGLRNYDGQLELIQAQDADIVGLQESDTNRISGGNSDVVRYFADRLNMYSYYGPKTVIGTFGIALLSKMPIDNPKTFYMYSVSEQTATIEAQVLVGGKKLSIFVTHLGNGGPIVQQEQLLGQVEGKENVVAIGDFNFKPGSPQYLLTVKILEDAWLQKWPQGVDDQGTNPFNRIDHIFISPGFTVLEARYLMSPHSDHPAVVATIGW